THDANFDGHTPLEGASAFLIATGKGNVLAATAKHLIHRQGGVNPELEIRDVDRSIKSWRLFPRTLPNHFVEVDKLGCDGLDGDHDWLILSVRQAGALPSTPLRLRSSPVKVNEKVFLVGCPYDETDCRQNVYRGTVTQRWEHTFRFDLDPPVDLRGFSGAPIVDDDGHVVGVMSIGFRPAQKGSKYLEGGGDDATHIYRFVEQ
ncbi:MAG TPA: serine protease, partial [Labilithrix sp.]|nr:serine protease [Labilithrix sp.]